MKSIAIIGLGYVGLPLAVEFGKKYQTTGFDVSRMRISQLKKFIDVTGEVDKKNLKKSKKLSFSFNQKSIKNCNIFIITVPTPINEINKPDLKILKEALKIVGTNLSKNCTVVLESTVYPGTVEEVCVPILEKESGLKLNKDFFMGYSPERINPGDKKHYLTNITKIVSGSNKRTVSELSKLYGSIIKAKIYKSPSIQVAEAAKVIENCQRDINIAFINELSLIFEKLNINTNDVLNAAETKWNFIPFRPGLVGGHCISVDPYYLTHRAEMHNYYPKVILAGREVNNRMSKFIVTKMINLLKSKKIFSKKIKLLIMGATFKENCKDIRNSQTFEIERELSKKNIKCDLYDPNISNVDIKKNKKFNIIKSLKKNSYHGIIVAVAHEQFKKMGIRKIKNLCLKDHVIFDVKGIFRSKDVDFQL